jgi:Fe-S-cluster containining protein
MKQETSFQKYFDKYQKIRGEVDASCKKLHAAHSKYTKCAKGCSDCCMNFSVLPVEFHAILDSIKNKEIQTSDPDKPDGCLFLIHNVCGIYHERPVICRSHGLPILHMNNSGDNWELSVCPLNFTTLPDEYFIAENCYYQDTFNSKLFMLNREFIKNFDEVKYKENELIELSKLASLIGGD